MAQGRKTQQAALLLTRLPTYRSLYDEFLLVVSLVFNGLIIWYAWNWD